MTRIGLALTAAVVVGGAAWSPGQDAPSKEPLVVIPFDFQSEFDDGRYGRMIGDMVWTKLNRRGRFVIPEAMLDVRDWSERNQTTLTPDTPLADVQRIVREDFGAQIAIWGRVERVEGQEFDVYDLWIRVADFSGAEPRMIHQVQARTKSVSEIPHVYVKAALDRLYGVQPQPEEAADEDKERRWTSAPNLVQGSFEQAGPRGPVGWDPLPQHVSRVALGDAPSAQNHVVRFQFPKSVAASSGVLYYSEFFPVEEGATYRFQCRWRTTGSVAKVFIKCYDELPTNYAEAGRTPKQRREVYRSQQNLKGAPRQWHVHSEEFTPRHTQFTPRWGRVMLYAYWPAGAVDWDDVVIKQVAPPPSGQPPKTGRPSLETEATSEELQRARQESPRGDR